MALIFIKDLGMQYPTSKSKHKSRMSLYECSNCDKRAARQTAVIKMGYTNWCKPCGYLSRKGLIK